VHPDDDVDMGPNFDAHTSLHPLERQVCSHD